MYIDRGQEKDRSGQNQEIQQLAVSMFFSYVIRNRTCFHLPSYNIMLISQLLNLPTSSAGSGVWREATPQGAWAVVGRATRSDSAAWRCFSNGVSGQPTQLLIYGTFVLSRSSLKLFIHLYWSFPPILTLHSSLSFFNNH